MELQISSWGNSLALRIPKSVIQLLKIKEGSKVEAVFKDGRLVLTPVDDLHAFEKLAEEVDLKKMVKKVNSRNNHDSSAFEDKPQGKEIW